MTIPTRLVISTVVDLIAALALMLLAPYAHEHLGTPDPHLGYGSALVLVVLTSLVTPAFRPMPH